MLLLGKLEINTNDINIKKKLKYSCDFSFVGLSYEKKDILFQTPKLYTKYGINDKYDKNFIDLSLQNIDNDNSIKTFKDNLDKIYDIIKTKYKNYNVVNYLKDLNFRLKVKENCKIFDTNKNNIEKIISNTYGNYIIYLQGFWIIKDDIYFQWYLLQAKIDLPIHLEEYAFIDENKPISKPIPKPPPLPVFKPNNNKIFIPKQKKKNSIQKKDIDVPSLDEIQIALSKLKSINKK